MIKTEELETRPTSLSMLKTDRNSVLCVVVRHRIVHHIWSLLDFKSRGEVQSFEGRATQDLQHCQLRQLWTSFRWPIFIPEWLVNFL